MKNELIKLYNTLSLIETKGESTKHMAQCLQYIEQLVRDMDKPVEEGNK